MASIYTHMNENIFSNLKEKHFYIKKKELMTLSIYIVIV